MPSRKNPPQVLPTLICLLWVLGLNGCGAIDIYTTGGKFSDVPEQGQRHADDFFIWLVSPERGDRSVIQTNSSGNIVRETPDLAGHFEQGAVKPTKAAGASSSLRAELAGDAAQAVAEDPLVILIGGTTAQILNLGTNTAGPQVQLSGQGSVRVAVSGDGAFAAVTVSRRNGPGGVDLINLTSMTRTATIGLPRACDGSGIAFIPGTDDFAVACTGDGTVRFYSLNGGRGSEPIRELTGCEGALAVEFTADGQRGLFSCTDNVLVYDVLSNSVVRTIEGFDQVLSIATTMDATRAYFGNDRGDVGDLIVVDLSTYEIVQTTEVGGFPATIAVGPDDQRVYVLGAHAQGRGLAVTDKQGVVLGFVPAPEFPVSFVVVRVAAST
jgi:hypothetical protein